MAERIDERIGMQYAVPERYEDFLTRHRLAGRSVTA